MEIIERRDFLKYIAACAAAGILSGCRREENTVAENVLNIDNRAPVTMAQAHTRIVVPQTSLTLPEPQTVTPKRPALCGVTRPAARTTASRKGISAVSRSYWHAAAPQASRMTRMGGYDRITVHHEGNATPNYDSNATAVACSLRRIQNAHCKTMHAGDIGYHFIIDRQGTIWQGRELRYQGAHVKSNNSNNIGIMCLGNFEIQQPTQAQVNTLARLCQALMQGYHIPRNKLYGHRELRSTACPGRNLFPLVVNIRNRVTIV